MLTAATGPITSLYIHVPFCAHKCEYCAFYSEASHGELIQRYVGALERELELVAPDLKPRTLFFGGGTPSLLNLSQWRQILSALERLQLLGAEEWTIECNPATVSLDKARLWRDYGVNRLSLGVQSFNEGLLDRLGRIHSREMVFKSFDLLRRAGFDRLNLDLMFAIPGQTLADWDATLDEALALGSEHLSCYEVIYEQDTPLYEQLQAGQFDVDEDIACAMYDELIDRTARAGFVQYEIANFARNPQNGAGHRSNRGTTGRRPEVEGEQCVSHDPGGEACRSGRADVLEGETARARSDASGQSFEPKEDQAPGAGSELSLPVFACQHNINYWRGGSCHALGPSASGYVRGVRTKNWSNTRLYCEQLERGQRAVESSEELPPLPRAGEIAAFGLRMNVGWPFHLFQQTTGYDLRVEWKDEMARLVADHWGRLDAQGFQLTRAGLRFADSAAALFLR
jgi:coproporphyrinogen III oxidase-like Fe-S oxidoreductase